MVDQEVRPEAGAENEMIVVEKLTKNVNDGHLREIFSSYGTIKDVELPINKQFMTNRGTAYILYTNPPDAESAIAHMHEAQLDGATISVSIVLPRRKFSRSPPPARRGGVAPPVDRYEARATRLDPDDIDPPLLLDDLRPQEEDMGEDHQEIKIPTGRVQGQDRGLLGRDRAHTTLLGLEAAVRRGEQEEGEGRVRRHRHHRREEELEDVGVRATVATAVTVGGVGAGAGVTMGGDDNGYVLRPKFSFALLDLSKSLNWFAVALLVLSCKTTMRAYW
ncbi:MAG: hypothetical protein MMC33_007252 [Icmadophila ericetorum]|nr:hypothetical protein [Icmadophila ericetorum]